MTQETREIGRSEGRIKLQFRPDVEGLRALAITLVVLSHAGLPFLRSGFIGVDIFFVLSGYLITSLLINEIELTGRLDFARFYARRARRLLPAAMLLVFVVCLVEAIVVSPIMQVRVLKAALVAIFYSSNLYFAHVGLHYFDRESAANPLLHTWSLAVEEQFYLVWPVLLLALTRVLKSRKGMMIALIAGAAPSFAFCVWLTRIEPATAYFQPLPRVWEFCAGGLIAYLPAAHFAQHKRLCTWMGVGGFVALLIGAQFIPEAVFPGYVAAVPVLGAMAVLLAGTGAPDSPIVRLLSTRTAQVLGGLSYSLYLWHWPALIIGQQLFHSNSAVVRLAAIAIAILIATLTHRAIENPIRFNSWLASKSGLTVALAASCALLCACGLGEWRLVINRSAQFHKFDALAHDFPALYGLGCAPERPDPYPRLCTFGETDPPELTVVLIGDSHAAEWFPALEQIAGTQRWKLITIVKPGCTALMLQEEVTPQMGRVCDEWRRLSFEHIQELHPDLVLVSSTSIHPGANGRMVTDVAVWEQAARGTFNALSQQGTKVRFIRDTPHADYNVLECLAQSEWDGRTQCPSVTPTAALYPDIYAAEIRAAASLGNVRFIDLSDTMCGTEQCSIKIGGTIVYRDRDHLTTAFNRSLAGVLFQRLNDSLH